MILTVEQMWILAHMNCDFAGWQRSEKGNYILVNDRQNGNATYAFNEDAKIGEIARHIAEKRNEFQQGKDDAA